MILEGISKLTPDQFKRCRLHSGLSVNQFAHELGIGRTLSVREMEKGKRDISGPIARNALVLAGVWPYEQDEPALFEFAKRITAQPEDDLSIAQALQELEARNG